jgi:UDP-4-amino-4-deoxy-L-arabinose formyltransferase/UDP-glucuronic acid dehydrogenase (UDP-4-keto-hexauronic acid decarboxylating)
VRCVEVEAKRYYGAGYQDIAARRPSIRKAQERLGWTPSTDLRSALRKTLDHYFRTASAGRAADASPPLSRAAGGKRSERWT